MGTAMNSILVLRLLVAGQYRRDGRVHENSVFNDYVLINVFLFMYSLP